MSNGNALGFLALGAAMWFLPLVAPALFPHVAIDGSSTRALWVQVMGVVQCLVGISFLGQKAWAVLFTRGAVVQDEPLRGAVATADWVEDALPANLLAVDFGAAERHRELPAAAAAFATASGAGSITLHGEHAALWRALTRAVPHERLAEVVARARQGVPPVRQSHPIAAAVFRHHPRHSWVHLAHPHLSHATAGEPTKLRHAAPTWGQQLVERAA